MEFHLRAASSTLLTYRWHFVYSGVKLRGIPGDLSSPTSNFRSPTFNVRSLTSDVRSTTSSHIQAYNETVLDIF